MCDLSEIEVAFLAESDALAGVQGVDDRDPHLRGDEGHAEAWRMLKRLAQAKAPLTLDDVWRVQALLRGADAPTPAPDTRVSGGDEGPAPSADGPPTEDPHAAACRRKASRAQALATLVDELASRVGETGPARDFHGSHTFILAGTFLQRLLALPCDEREMRDGRLARLVCNYILVHRGWSMVIFRAQDSARLEAERHSAALLGAYLIEKVREHVDCGHCRIGQVTRTQVGLSTDAYQCGGCGAEFKLDWKGLQTAYKRALEPAPEAPPLLRPPSRFTMRAR